ncbi:MAG: hypothetical protein E7446_04710 [Ruminococcaceae bacterium]|nr:hypothetical protein [Oscillospiraceae bacterium]
MKRKIPLSFYVAAIVLVIILLVRGPKIGTVRGAEMEKMVIHGVTYVQNPFLDFSYADKGRYLGRATAGGITFRVYAVKGDPDHRYLYRLWSWEGAFYERKD